MDVLLERCDRAEAEVEVLKQDLSESRKQCRHQFEEIESLRLLCGLSESGDSGEFKDAWEQVTSMRIKLDDANNLIKTLIRKKEKQQIMVCQSRDRCKGLRFAPKKDETAEDNESQEDMMAKTEWRVSLLESEIDTKEEEREDAVEEANEYREMSEELQVHASPLSSLSQSSQTLS